MRRYLAGLGVGVLFGAGLAGCGNKSALAPNPTRYIWPDTFSYHVDTREESVRGATLASRREATKVLRFAVRYDGSYVVSSADLVETAAAGGASARPQLPQVADTVPFLVRLGRLGEYADVQRGCDPGVPACRAVPLSGFLVELRRIVPHLPVWWPPRGDAWADTLTLDTLPGPGVAVRRRVAVYRVRRDTTIRGRQYWVVAWYSLTRTWGRAAAARGAKSLPLLAEQGEVLVDKQRLLPAYAAWSGQVASPPGAPRREETGMGERMRERYSGRAWLVGSALGRTGGGR